MIKKIIVVVSDTNWICCVFVWHRKRSVAVIQWQIAILLLLSYMRKDYTKCYFSFFGLCSHDLKENSLLFKEHFSMLFWKVSFTNILATALKYYLILLHCSLLSKWKTANRHHDRLIFLFYADILPWIFYTFPPKWIIPVYPWAC